VVVTVTSGGRHVVRCLEALQAQRDAPAIEILVPVDPSVPGVRRWRECFPGVAFPQVPVSADLRPGDPGQAHLLYDLRRATGLAVAAGAIVALTEDHARPDPDWCAQILRAHARLPHAAIGGTIANGGDQPLAWAVYFSDFARYQPPLPEGPGESLSDVNVSYKRAPLEAVRCSWQPSYHETAVHGALRRRGAVLWREPRMRVVQERGRLRLGPSLRERFAWGQLYAGKRVRELTSRRHRLLALTVPLLPGLLLLRQLRLAVQRRRSLAPFLRALPWLALLVVSWSAGEAAGLWTGRPVRNAPGSRTPFSRLRGSGGRPDLR